MVNLPYSVTNMPWAGNSEVVESADGTYNIILWNENPIWDAINQVELDPVPSNIVLNLGSVYANVQVFDPMNSAAPYQALNWVGQIPLTLSSHSLIVKILPY